MTHVLGGNFPLFCKTLPFKLLHEFIVGSHPILMDEKVGEKFHANLRLLLFLCLSYTYVVEYNLTISADQTKKIHLYQRWSTHHNCIAC